LETTLWKLGMPKKARESANAWYACGWGMGATTKAATAQAAVISSSSLPRQFSMRAG
jgi:ABC-type tungstate transport system permease subunit